MDIGVFWVGLFVPAAVWFFFGVGSIFRLSFDWLLLIATAFALSFANIVGYVRCKKGERKWLPSPDFTLDSIAPSITKCIIRPSCHSLPYLSLSR